MGEDGTGDGEGLPGIEERLRLLQESGQVSAGVCSITLDLLGRIEEEYGLALSGDNAGMLATHLAMSLQRLADGARIEEAPDVVVGEAGRFGREWAFVEGLNDIVRECLSVDIGKAEMAYMVIHIRALLEREGRA